MSLLPVGQLGHLRVVQVYKHVGTMALATGAQSAEWASRANLANAMTGARAKPLKHATFVHGLSFGLGGRLGSLAIALCNRHTGAPPPTNRLAKLCKAYLRPYGEADMDPTP